MAKKKQFDEHKVLDQIADYFWQHGYAATKVDQISELTGLTKTSIYNAYGNKEALFIRVLDHYVQKSLMMRSQLLDFNKSMAFNLEQLLNVSVLHRPKSQISNGCLITNTIVELAANEPALHERAVSGYGQIRKTMHDFFAHYVDAGNIVEGYSAQELTDVFMTFVQGLRVQSRNTAPDACLSGSIKTFLQLMRSLEC